MPENGLNFWTKLYCHDNVADVAESFEWTQKLPSGAWWFEIILFNELLEIRSVNFFTYWEIENLMLLAQR